jgi:hypothetical protein
VGRTYIMMQGRPAYFVAYDSATADPEPAADEASPAGTALAGTRR